jgi:two-component system, NtrC family, sensor kinase
MSLRARIILLFAATLVLALAVASYLGERVATRAIETALRERSADLAKAVAEELDLSPSTDVEKAADPLVAALQRRRGVRSAELAIRRRGEVRVARVTFGPDGPETEVETGATRAFPLETAVSLVDYGEGRGWRVDLPLREARTTFGALRLETTLSEVEEIATTERDVFFLVAGVGAAVLAVAFTFLLGRMLVRPLSDLAVAIEGVQSGAIDAARVPGVERTDEIGVLARGLRDMLERVRRFNADLAGMVSDATDDLARKNRALAEVNRLLFEARRDLTSKERLAALGQLSGTIAHELGNPLNTISGHVQLLARDPACPPELRAGLGVVEGEVRRMTAIIRRFLDSARGLKPEAERVDLAALVDEALTLNVPAADRARLEVAREVPPDLAQVRLDPALVGHVLGNLVSNAVEAMPDGGRLEVRAARRGVLLGLSVCDSGAGIQPEERKRIFEPFYTTKPAGKGTGLGLAISREIAAALRGRIEVASVPGAGATFTLWIPAPAADGAEEETHDAALPDPGGR